MTRSVLVLSQLGRELLLALPIYAGLECPIPKLFASYGCNGAPPPPAFVDPWRRIRPKHDYVLPDSVKMSEEDWDALVDELHEESIFGESTTWRAKRAALLKARPS